MAAGGGNQDGETDDRVGDDRKRLRVGHRSERGGINAVRTLLENHGMVVDEVDGRSDYGRDLLVDLTAGDAITGAVIGMQIKGIRKYVQNNWTMPADAKDLRFWADSSVPVIGVLWDPDTKAMRWTNLSAHARANPRLTAKPGPGTIGEVDPHRVRFPAEQELNDAGLPAFIDAMHDYLRRSSSSSLLGLCAGAGAEDADDDAQHAAVADCWALGRNDARAFVLLRRSVLDLSDAPLADAIVVLSHLVPHPDIIWTDRNWVSDEIKTKVRKTLTWSAAEVMRMVEAVENVASGSDHPAWTRGGIGQCLWYLLTEDPAFTSMLNPAIELAGFRRRPDVAATLAWLHQYWSDDPAAVIDEAARLCPAVTTEPLYDHLLSAVGEFGRADLW